MRPEANSSTALSPIPYPLLNSPSFEGLADLHPAGPLHRLLFFLGGGWHRRPDLEHRELLLDIRAVALGAHRLLARAREMLECVAAPAAGVIEDGHRRAYCKAGGKRTG